jgi:DNA-binding CsgD family transcriptional regulator
MGRTLDQLNPGLAGRGAERGALGKSLDAASEGRPVAVVVHGEAGVGKTRLVRELADEARSSGCEVLWGTCVHFGAASLPFAPVVGALQSWLVHAEAAERDAMLSGVEFERLLSMLRGDRIQEPDRLLPLVDAAFNRISRLRTTVVVLDDLQWADVASLDVLAYLIAGFSEQRLLLVATCRDESRPDGHPLHGWLADMRRMPSFGELTLDRLDLAATESQIAGLIGHHPDVGFAAQVLERSGGNPYLTELLVRGVGADARELPKSPPAALRDALLARWHGLTAVAREVMRVLAVGGRPVGLAVLESASLSREIQPSMVSAALAEAEQQGVARRDADGLYWFRHPLLAEVLYDGLPPGQAEAIHATYAHLLDAAPDLGRGLAAADLAVHYARAGNVDDAYRWSVSAADVAAGLRAPAEEATHLERACDLWPEASSIVRGGQAERIDLMLRASRAAGRAGRLELAESLVGRALAMVDRDRDPLLASRLLVEWCLRTWERSAPRTAVRAEHHEALRLTDAFPDSIERVYALTSLASDEHWDGNPEADRHAEEAVDVARRSGSRLALANALGCRASMHCSDADAGAGLRDAEASYRIAEACDDAEEMGSAAIWQVNALWRLDRIPEAVAVAREGFESSLRGGSWLWSYFLAGMASEGMLHLGRWEECRGLLRAGLAARCGGIPGAQLRLAASRLAVRTGDVVQGRQHFDRALELVSPAFPGLRTALALSAAELFIAAGEPATAVSWTRRLLAPDANPHLEMFGEIAVAFAGAVAELAQVARDSADPAGVRRAVSMLDEIPERLSKDRPPVDGLAGPMTESTFALLEAEVARARDDVGQPELWERAVDVCRSSGAVWDEAVGCWHWAQAGLADGSPRRSVAEPLRRAHGIAMQLGAAPLAARVDSLARAARINLGEPEPAAGPSSSPDDAVAALTNREREVLSHLAAGRSNSEVARALGISAKTASVHVSNILRKTGTSSRTEAAELARASVPGPVE